MASADVIASVKIRHPPHRDQPIAVGVYPPRCGNSYAGGSIRRCYQRHCSSSFNLAGPLRQNFLVSLCIAGEARQAGNADASSAIPARCNSMPLASTDALWPARKTLRPTVLRIGTTTLVPIDYRRIAPPRRLGGFLRRLDGSAMA